MGGNCAEDFLTSIFQSASMLLGMSSLTRDGTNLQQQLRQAPHFNNVQVLSSQPPDKANGKRNSASDEPLSRATSVARQLSLPGSTKEPLTKIGSPTGV